MKDGTEAKTGLRELSANHPPAAVLSMAASDGSAEIARLVETLAKMHRFDLGRPGYTLWVQAPRMRGQRLGDLAICVCWDGFTLGVSKPESPGFRVAYSRSWSPLRAFNVHGSPYRNLASANEEMIHLVSCYLASSRAFVTDLICTHDVPG